MPSVAIEMSQNYALDLTATAIGKLLNTDKDFNIITNVSHFINPLKPELNPSAQRRLTRFFTGDFAS
jgi:hypothetical protein